MEILLKKDWSIFGSTFVLGSAFLEGKLLKGVSLAQYIDGRMIEGFRLADILQELNGFFAVVYKDKDGVELAADKVRSIPLFYYNKENALVISDNPYTIKDKFKITHFDNSVSRIELLLLRYVTGSETLCKDIKQTCAGEVVKLRGNQAHGVKYYNFVRNMDRAESRKELLTAHSEILNSVFDRLVNYANGRTVVIPLSGGYDSRLIAVMLKKLDYKNVVTFTYGKSDNPECIVSKQVAANLGFDWKFIPYTNHDAYEWYNSEERTAYDVFADNLSSTCLDREWPAVWELKKQKLIPEDALFVPGHTGDFLTGGHFPLKIYDIFPTEENIISYIFKKHYVMWNWSNEKPWRDILSAKILACIKTTIPNIEENVSATAVENWDWQERQSKFIVNSVRIYEFFGYDWWLPLWDSELINFWSDMPLKFLIDCNLYIDSMAELYSKIGSVSFREARLRDSTLNDTLMQDVKKGLKGNIMKNSFLRKLLLRIKKNKSGSRRNGLDSSAWNSDWEQSFGRMDESIYKELLPFMTGRASCTTLEKLGYISYTDNAVSDDVVGLLRDMRGY